MNVHSFSMVFELGSTTSIIKIKAKITCEPCVKIEFLNVSTVVVSGFEFIGCIGNKVTSVGQFQLENSIFYSPVDVNGTALILTETMACLDRVTFVTSNIAGLVDEHDSNKTEITRALSSHRSTVTIIQGWFEGYSIKEPGAVAIVHGKQGSNITIFNATFVRNSAMTQHDCYHYGCSVATILYAESESALEICYSTFAQNKGALVKAFEDLAITHSEFTGNIAYQGVPMIHVTDAKLTTHHSSFTNTFAIIHDRVRYRYSNSAVMDQVLGGTLEDLTAAVLVKHNKSRIKATAYVKC